MRVAVVGSRNMEIKHLGEYLPEKVTEIVSGGARGIRCVRKKVCPGKRLETEGIFSRVQQIRKSGTFKAEFADY